MSYEEIRARFNVPAKKGARVRHQGKPGRVTNVRGLMVRVRLDGSTASRPFFPGELEWLDQPPESTPGPEPESQPRQQD